MNETLEHLAFFFQFSFAFFLTLSLETFRKIYSLTEREKERTHRKLRAHLITLFILCSQCQSHHLGSSSKDLQLLQFGVSTHFSSLCLKINTRPHQHKAWIFPIQVPSQFVSIPLSQNMCSSKEAGLKRYDYLFLKAMNICKWSKRENFCPKFPNYFPSNILNQLQVTSTPNKRTRFDILQKIIRLPEQLCPKSLWFTQVPGS